MEDETIFDKILKKEIPCKIIYEDKEVLAFEDINPQAPTHVLVIPKTKMQSFDSLHEFESDIIGRYMQKVSFVAKKLKLDKDGYRIVFNHGKYGQQTVPYIHAHILGGKQLTWPPG